MSMLDGTPWQVLDEASSPHALAENWHLQGSLNKHISTHSRLPTGRACCLPSSPAVGSMAHHSMGNDHPSGDIHLGIIHLGTSKMTPAPNLSPVDFLHLVERIAQTHAEPLSIPV